MNIQMSCLRSKCVRLSRCNDIYLVTISDSTMATDCNSSTEVLTDFPLHPLAHVEFLHPGLPAYIRT